MTSASDVYDCANQAKANFEDIYNAPDPRAYYARLNALDYQITTNAKPVFQKIMAAMGKQRPMKIVDVGCSYGVNAAMLRYDLTFNDLAQHYAHERFEQDSVAETVMRDASVYADLKHAIGAQFVGLDVAGEAAGYADAVGLLDDAVVENLEIDEMSGQASAIMSDADLIITTGAVGYVGEETFGKIAEAADRPPWVAAFVLRQFPFNEIAGRLAGHGLVTEKLPDRTFLQRRFRDRDEQEGAIEAVRAAGCDPEGVETEGYFHAELYLARPAGEIEAPIVDMRLV